MRLRVLRGQIEHLQPTVCRDHHVGQLEVAVRDPSLMGGTDRVGQRNREVEDLRQRQAAFDDEIAERLSFDVLHRQKEHPIRLFHGVDRDDVGMVQSGDALRLDLETGATFRVSGRRAREDLEGNVALQSRVTRAIDLAHAAGAKRRQDLIRADPSTYRERHQNSRCACPL